MIYSERKVSKNKAYSFQMDLGLTDIVGINFVVNMPKSCDHYGVSFSFRLIYFSIDFSFYDVRHFD